MSDAQLSHLETFAQAAEVGNFTAAAEALGLTQAAVSQRNAALEQALGMSLRWASSAPWSPRIVGAGRRR